MKIKNLIFLCIAFASAAHCEETKNYYYAGPYKGADDRLSVDDFKSDLDAAFAFRKRYPLGFVTVFGGSNLKRETATYQKIYDFTKEWSDLYGNRIPILAGAGPGAMEAANRGAYDSRSKISIGYTTYYKTDKAEEAFWKYNGQTIITDGLIFSSVSIREAMMILHSSAIIFSPGGSGTEWEIFQVLEMTKSSQLTKMPIYFLGTVDEWSSFWQRIDTLAVKGMLGKNSDGTLRRLDSYFIFIDDMKKEIPSLAKQLKISD